MKHKKLPLYLPYKPYEYTFDYDYSWGRRPNGAKYFRKRPVYRPVENMDYSNKNKHYIHESNVARSVNRREYEFWHKDLWLLADNRHDFVKGKQIAKFVGAWWKRYKDKKLEEAYNRVFTRKVHRPVNRKRTIEVIDLT